MAIREVVVRPPYSIVLVGDRSGTVPATMAGRLVSATESCLAVSTRSDVDGPTRIRLIDAADSAPDLPRTMAFQGELRLHSRELTVASVDGQVYLRGHVDRPTLGISVFVDDDDEPTDISVVLDNNVGQPQG
jgi:hypothetical protein